ncbi:hypothetical protein [Roseibium sp. RKSG952]|uniref:hypothetical protein n=1 Tax=Roseibium sp. RKSG952 TaxID=2529384 RepID=UPI0012BCCA0B|nr:hypothetical protein [Roseibium sp. RKSG952]MTH97523.1 hypothetical protein [Roseibium sp. RKSG952]
MNIGVIFFEFASSFLMSLIFCFEPEWSHLFVWTTSIWGYDPWTSEYPAVPSNVLSFSDFAISPLGVVRAGPGVAVLPEHMALGSLVTDAGNTTPALDHTEILLVTAADAGPAKAARRCL